MKNEACKVRPEIVNVNSNEAVFYPFNIKTSKFSGKCNSINNLYAKICVPDVVKNLNIKVFSLMSRTKETRHTKWHETCKCKCRLDATVCDNKQRWNNYKCQYECKELINKDVCNKEYAWNPSNCECECDKSCDFGEYLDYENCKCRKRLADKLVEECNENIDKVKLTEIALSERKCYYTVFIVLGAIVLTICIGIGAYFVYYKDMNRNKNNVSVYDYVYHAKNYQPYKMREMKQINIKNRTYYFYNDIIDIKKFDAMLLKIDKNHSKILVFTTLDILQLKKLMIVKTFAV